MDNCVHYDYFLFMCQKSEHVYIVNRHCHLGLLSCERAWGEIIYESWWIYHMLFYNQIILNSIMSFIAKRKTWDEAQFNTMTYCQSVINTYQCILNWTLTVMWHGLFRIESLRFVCQHVKKRHSVKPLVQRDSMLHCPGGHMCGALWTATGRRSVPAWFFVPR